jgi:uncharacterized damage-inducible protein DinB
VGKPTRRAIHSLILGATLAWPAHLAETPEDLKRAVKIHDRDATVDGMYLRIIVHANEHMGQLIAYARMTGVVPPWSKKSNE